MPIRKLTREEIGKLADGIVASAIAGLPTNISSEDKSLILALVGKWLIEEANHLKEQTNRDLENQPDNNASVEPKFP